MSQEQLDAFLAKVKDDSGLQANIQSATSPEEIVKIATTAGFAISREDLDAQSELSTTELESIAGGKALGYGDTNRPKSIIDDGKC